MESLLTTVRPLSRAGGDEPWIEPQPLRPRKTAALLAGSYIALCAIYIVTSSALVASLAASPEQQERLEVWKGIGFVVVTGVAFYFAAAAWLGRIESQRRRLAAQQERLVGADRRALAGEMAASIAHDINNALMVADLHVDDLGNFELPPLAREEAARGIEQIVRHVGDLARRLTAIARGSRPGEQVPLDLSTVVAEALDLVASHGKVRTCRLVREFAAPLPIRGHAASLKRMVINLVLNAAEATEGRGRIRVATRGEGGQALVEVQDDGPGVAAELRERIFEPCWTTKAGGTGLGLVSVSAAVAEHGGALEVGSSPEGGASFRIALPMRALAAEAASA